MDIPESPLTPSTRSEEGLTILGVLGTGGMGLVQEAHQLSVDRVVALKTLKVGRQSEQHKEQLIREAWVLGLLEHPNIVPVYTLTTHDEGPAIVCKRIVGREWSAYLRTPGLLNTQLGIVDELEWNLGVLLKVIDAVRFAHSRGILHRDLKPSNVMIGEFGEVYLMDWGLAVSMRLEHAGKMQLARDVFRTAGTYCYLAPEMLRPQSLGISERTDVYQLGGMLYEICMGQPPHCGDNDCEMEESIRRSRPSFREGLPTELVAICLQAMRAQPTQRFGSAADFRLAILDFLRHRGASQLRHGAEGLLDDLYALFCENPRPARSDVYSMVDPCRFAFQQALVVWPGDGEAKAGYADCLELAAEFELEEGEPDQALSLLGGLGDAELRQRCETASVEKLQRARDDSALRRRTSRDVDAGSRRTAITVIALGWALGPLALALLCPTTSYSTQAATQLGFLSMWLLVALFGDRWVHSTEINFRSYSMVLGTTVLAVVVKIGSFAMGVSSASAQVYDLFVFLVAGLLATLLIDWRIWPSAVAYLLAFLIASRDPSLCLWAMSASNVILAITVAVIWREGASFRGSKRSSYMTRAI